MRDEVNYKHIPTMAKYSYPWNMGYSAHSMIFEAGYDANLAGITRCNFTEPDDIAAWEKGFQEAQRHLQGEAR